jgi:hypothetical protein
MTISQLISDTIDVILAKAGIQVLRVQKTGVRKQKTEAIEWGIGNWEFGLRPIGAYVYAPAGKWKIYEKSRARRAKRREKVKGNGWKGIDNFAKQPL